MERNASRLESSSLFFGVPLEEACLPISQLFSLYSLETLQLKNRSFLGKRIPLPVNLSELDLQETHIKSILSKLSIQTTLLQFFLLSHDA